MQVCSFNIFKYFFTIYSSVSISWNIFHHSLFNWIAQHKSLWLNFQFIPSRLFSSRCTGAYPIKFINTHTHRSLTKPDAIVAVCPQPWSWPPEIILELVFSVWRMVLELLLTKMNCGSSACVLWSWMSVIQCICNGFKPVRNNLY